MASLNIDAREITIPTLEKHIIFCQKDISKPTKIISDFIKNELSVNNNNERTTITNVYTDGLLKKYINGILQKNKIGKNKEKLKYAKKHDNTIMRHFFYVIVETKEIEQADNTGIYPNIKISTKEYKSLNQLIINKLKNEGYTISNNKNSARYILSIKIEDILKINAP
jgi:hypothetical protein